MTEPDPQPGGPRALGERTWPDVGGPLLLVPVGSTEQHGPHLPLDTDTVIAVAVAERLADRVRDLGTDAVVAPAIAYGASGQHEDFPGTVSVGTAALRMLLVEYGRSACRWASRVVFVNGHGGNLDALAGAVPLLRAEGRDVAWLPCAPPAGDPVPDAHAGREETAILAHLRPGAVALDRLEAGTTAPLARVVAELRANGVRAVAANGVLGDPRGATAEQGAALLDRFAEGAWARLGRGAPGADGRLVVEDSGG